MATAETHVAALVAFRGAHEQVAVLTGAGCRTAGARRRYRARIPAERVREATQ